MQSVPTTTKVVSSNPAHGEVYSIQHWYSLSVTCAGRWFSPGTSVFSTNKTDRDYITDLLLNVALNTITITQLIERLLYVKKS